MEEKELRVGNYFEWNELSSIGKGLDVVTLSNINYHALMRPLELTEEWLIKFGFNKGLFDVDDVFGYDSKIQYNITFNPKNWDEYLTAYMNVFYDEDYFFITIDDFKLFKINHVHELQNLYFSLTGEELTITKRSE